MASNDTTFGNWTDRVWSVRDIENHFPINERVIWNRIQVIGWKGNGKMRLFTYPEVCIIVNFRRIKKGFITIDSKLNFIQYGN